MSSNPYPDTYPNPETLNNDNYTDGSSSSQTTVTDVALDPNSPDVAGSIGGLRPRLEYPIGVSTEDEYNGNYIEFKVLKFEGSTFLGGSFARSEALGLNDAVLNQARTAGAERARDLFESLSKASVRVQKGITDITGLIRGVGQGGFAAASPSLSRPKIDPVGSIKLFLPLQVQEAYSPSWQSADIFQGGSFWQLGAVDGVQSLLKDAPDVAEEVMGKLGAMGWNVQSLTDLSLRNANRAVNNHLEHFFKGVGFRKFSYTFSMVPKKLEEAKNIRDIVNAFKLASAPQLKNPGQYYGRYWVYPNVFNIRYNRLKAHKIGMCALENVAVNYSGAATNQTFEDGWPIQTDLTLNFTEMELMHKNKFYSEDGKETF